MNPADTTTQQLLDKLDALELRTLAAERRLAALTTKHEALVASLDFLNQKFIANVDGMLDLNRDLENALEGHVRDLRTLVEPLLAERLPRLGEVIDEITDVIGVPAVYAPERLKIRAPLPEPEPQPAAKNLPRTGGF